jgi:uncharacterized protein (TIGR01370 family)
MRITLFLTLLMGLSGVSLAYATDSGAVTAPNEKFAVYYSDRAPVARFKPYNVLVLADNFPSLQPLAEEGKTLLGYISLGEINKDSPYYKNLQSKGLLIKENKDWKGSYVVDIRSPVWQKIVIEDVIPKILRDGFGGVFFDTLDSPLESERENRNDYSGMGEDAIKLIRAVRMHYPSIKIMVNRAYTILPQIAPLIDMELGESVFADYDFDKKTYGKVAPALYRQQIQGLQAAKQINPAMKIYTLDYADPHDRAAMREIYRTQRANGFTPYVATIGLEEIIDEPENP